MTKRTRKVDDNTLGVEETVEQHFNYERLLSLRDVRVLEFAAAQANLDEINFLLAECERLGITVREEAIEE